MHDLVIRQGRVVDGTGAPGVVSTVAGTPVTIGQWNRSFSSVSTAFGPPRRASFSNVTSGKVPPIYKTAAASCPALAALAALGTLNGHVGVLVALHSIHWTMNI